VYEILRNAAFVLVAVLLAFSFYYGFKTRRQTEPVARGLFQSKQNMAMGLMLAVLSVYPLYLMPGSIIRMLVGAAFLVIGLFNLFAGIRNYAVYKSRNR
jgi:uncharacterized membrane protein YdjX (TVP38/TMEM64 family)